jgi:hypothetical protein
MSDARKPANDYAADMDARFGAGAWHSDDLRRYRLLPRALRAFLDAARDPARPKGSALPPLFATRDGQRVRVVTALHLGDLGITEDLSAVRGYTDRVFIPQLREFSAEPEGPSPQDNMDALLAAIDLLDMLTIASAKVLKNGAGWGEVVRRLDVLRATRDRLDPPLEQPPDGPPEETP